MYSLIQTLPRAVILRSWLKKIASGIAAIKRVRQFVPPASLNLIYKALIQPHFDYCNVVSGSCGINLHTQRDIHKVLMVFKSLNGLTPDYLSSKFIALSNTTSCNFRDSVNKLTLFLNAKEMVSFRAKTWYLHLWKYYLLLWLHGKPSLSHKKLLKWNGLVFRWCLYNK